MQKKDVYFPMFINLNGKNICIFGAGKIALRRTKTMLEMGANVKIVAPSILDEFYSIKSDKLVIVKDFYSEKYLEDVFIVLSITNDNKVNDKVYIDCKNRNIIVNIASDKNKCDFLFPGVICNENYTVGICANGKNHKLAKNLVCAIRDFLQRRKDFEN